MLHKGSILCVDDEPGILRVLRAQLESFLGEDHEILLAESGEDAMKLLETFDASQKILEMVIADHKMPGIQGAQLLEWIAKKFPDTIRIMLTGQAGLEDAIYAVNHAGLHQYIEKPWSDEDLKIVVKNRLEEFHLALENKKLVSELQRKNLMFEQKNREFMESQKALLQAEKLAMIGKLSSGIFHEINNRLTILIPCAELAKELKMSDPEFKEYVTEIVELHFLLKDMMNEWVHFARNEPYIGTIEHHPLAEIIEETLKVFEWNDRFRGVKITKDLSRALPAVPCQKSRIKQCILNLVQNALDVLPSEQGELHFRLKQEEDSAVIEVQDNGPGIPPEILKRIGHPFSTTKHSTHLGLGLYIVKRIIDHHDGYLKCSSGPEKGTLFQIFLPLKTESTIVS
jgi:two-component system chemotaxis response regulator CheY